MKYVKLIALFLVVANCAYADSGEQFYHDTNACNRYRMYLDNLPSRSSIKYKCWDYVERLGEDSGSGLVGKCRQFFKTLDDLHARHALGIPLPKYCKKLPLEQKCGMSPYDHYSLPTYGGKSPLALDCFTLKIGDTAYRSFDAAIVRSAIGLLHKSAWGRPEVSSSLVKAELLMAWDSVRRVSAYSIPELKIQDDLGLQSESEDRTSGRYWTPCA